MPLTSDLSIFFNYYLSSFPGVINERQKSNTEQIDSIPSEIPSTSSCTDEVLQTMDADCHLRNDANRLEKLYIAHNGKFAYIWCQSLYVHPSVSKIKISR